MKLHEEINHAIDDARGREPRRGSLELLMSPEVEVIFYRRLPRGLWTEMVLGGPLGSRMPFKGVPILVSGDVTGWRLVWADVVAQGPEPAEGKTGETNP